MTITDLAELVRKMRCAQSLYFRQRTPSALDASKALEKLVDNAVSEILREPDLFDVRRTGESAIHEMVATSLVEAATLMLANEDCGGDDWWRGWKMLKAALAKARGETP